MNTVTPVFDSRSMPLAEPSTAPSAFSLWRWLGERATAKVLARQDALARHDRAQATIGDVPQLADHGRGDVDRLGDRHDR